MKNNKNKKDDCIFCKIVEGKIPSNKVYENSNILAFLTIEPLTLGHTLVIPKKHFENIFDVDERNLNEVSNAIKKISSSMRSSLNASGVNILNANGRDAQQSVFHLHFHIVPRYSNDNLDTWPKSDFKDNNLKLTSERIAKYTK